MNGTLKICITYATSGEGIIQHLIMNAASISSYFFG